VQFGPWGRSQAGGEVARIVVLNGVGSVGKSTLARAVQARAQVPFLHVAMDEFLEMLPTALQDHPDGICYHRNATGVAVTVGPVGKRLMSGMLDCVAALAAAGNDLIFDTVMDRSEVQICRMKYAAFAPCFVGLTAPLAVLEAREVARGDRDVGLAREQLGKVHVGVDDDLTLDMASLTSDEAALVLCERFGL
jgi:chloramphenicol 3-O phosphotransferase